MIDLNNNSLQTKTINKLKLYFGDDFIVDENFIIHQPSIQDIFDIGENEFFSVLNVFIGNTTMYRVTLWEKGIDWNNISDFELFMMLVNNLEKNKTTELLFGDIDFTKFKQGVLSVDAENQNEVILYDLERNIIIDEKTYLFMREGLRYIFDIYPKDEFAKGKMTKEWIIDEEKEKIKMKKNENSVGILLPIISFCLSHPGFKYKSSELREISYVELMDSVKQLQHNEHVIALLHRVNSGFVDTSKIEPERFSFIRQF